MEDTVEERAIAVAQRLCSEIQLFDLCDLESCRFKRQRYCTNEEMLEKFESIKEEDDRQTLLYEEGADDEDVLESDSECDDYVDSFECDEE